jgi:hypothetical protein
MHADHNPNDQIVIGLFGTAGSSTWRAPLIDACNRARLQFFNPQVANWNSSLAAVEAAHLAKDRVLVFVVTGETYGTGSLVELGFAIAQVKGTERQLLIFVEGDLDDELTNAVAREESLRARALVRGHLGRLGMWNVHVLDSRDDLPFVATELFRELILA